MSILNFEREDKKFRPVQVDVLKWIEENWDKADVFVIEGPTATGKSLIVKAIADYSAHKGISTAIVTPTKILQDQYVGEFDDLDVLKGMTSYPCIIGGTCKETKKNLGECCRGQPGDIVCGYLQARDIASRSMGCIFNFHSLQSSKYYKGNLIIDEAHNSLNFLYDFYALKFWKCEVGYEDDRHLDGLYLKELVTKMIADLTADLVLLQTQHADKKNLDRIEDEIERLGYVRDTIAKFQDDLLIEKVKGDYFGKIKELRKTSQEYIYVKPLRVDVIAQSILWPSSTIKKKFLLSATIFENDIERLGLARDGKRVAFFRAPSIIDKARRSFIVWPVASMAYRNRSESKPKILEGIRKIAERHKDTKGLIHCTYEMALYLKDNLHDPRFIFHGKMDKEAKYQEFLSRKDPVVLVASGMEEGIDLAHDAGRWQVITQLMRPSIEDRLNRWHYANKPDIYNLEAVRKIMQQTGRICRGPTDVGYTYMIDSEFYNFFAQTAGMWPDYFKEAMVWPK